MSKFLLVGLAASLLACGNDTKFSSGPRPKATPEVTGGNDNDIIAQNTPNNGIEPIPGVIPTNEGKPLHTFFGVPVVVFKNSVPQAHGLTAWLNLPAHTDSQASTSSLVTGFASIFE